jgi:hypothetical protein
MSNEKKYADDCGCEHHDHSKSLSHHLDGKCPTDLLFDKIIDNLKKQFEEENK